MEGHGLIRNTEKFDTTGQHVLASSGKWSKFIGISYLVMAGLILLITVLLFANLDMIANEFMNISGISQESLDFMMGAGKWIFALLMAISCFIMTLNGYFLVKFGISTNKFVMFQDEKNLSESFISLGRYLMLTTILSVFSTCTSVLAFLYYILM